MALIVPTVDQQMNLCDQLKMQLPPCLCASVRKKKFFFAFSLTRFTIVALRSGCRVENGFITIIYQLLQTFFHPGISRVQEKLFHHVRIEFERFHREDESRE